MVDLRRAGSSCVRISGQWHGSFYKRTSTRNFIFYLFRSPQRGSYRNFIIWRCLCRDRAAVYCATHILSANQIEELPCGHAELCGVTGSGHAIGGHQSIHIATIVLRSLARGIEGGERSSCSDCMDWILSNRDAGKVWHFLCARWAPCLTRYKRNGKQGISTRLRILPRGIQSMLHDFMLNHLPPPQRRS